MPEFTTFVEAQREPIRWTIAGPQTARRGTVVAASGHDVKAVLASNGIIEGGPYKNEQGSIPDSSLRCRGVEVVARPGAPFGGTGLYAWSAEYGYLSRAGAFSYPTPPPAVDGKAQFRIDYSTVQKTIDRDVSGNPIVNSSGEPFDPSPTIPYVEERLVLTWLRSFETAFAAHQYRKPYRNRINSAEFLGAEPHELFCEGITMQQSSLPGDESAVGVYQFEGSWLVLDNYDLPSGIASVGPFPLTSPPGATLADRRIRGWSYTTNDVGRRQLVHPYGSAAGVIKVREIRESDTDPNAELVREPVSLRRSVGPTGELVTTWDTGKPHVKQFQVIKEIDFNLLELEL